MNYTVYETQVSYKKVSIEKIVINQPSDAANHLRGFMAKNVENPMKEHCFVIMMNSRNIIIGTKIISIGTIHQTLVSPKEILKEVLLSGATAFILSHNHPSGDPQPSGADNRITQRVREAANVMDIIFFDHIVMGEVENDPCSNGFYSFRQAGSI